MTIERYSPLQLKILSLFRDNPDRTFTLLDLKELTNRCVSIIRDAIHGRSKGCRPIKEIVLSKGDTGRNNRENFYCLSGGQADLLGRRRKKVRRGKTEAVAFSKTIEHFGVLHCDHCGARIMKFTGKNPKSRSLDGKLHFCIKSRCKEKYFFEKQGKIDECES